MRKDMQKCYFSEKHTRERWTCIIFSLFVSITLIGFGIYTAPATESGILSGILFFSGLLFIVYGILYDLYMSREYALSENGITIRYGKRKIVHFPWKYISQICICVIHQGKIEGVKDDVIWCTVGTIKKGPPNMARRWNEAEYGFIHFHSVLTMEYTPERLANFKRYSNRDIPDYRDVIYR